MAERMFGSDARQRQRAEFFERVLLYRRVYPLRGAQDSRSVLSIRAAIALADAQLDQPRVIGWPPPSIARRSRWPSA